MGKRDTTKKTILKAASEVLTKKGLFETSMEDVASAASCHRRTLYRYFPQREDLLYEVVISMLEEQNRFQLALLPTLTGTGLEKFSAFLTELTGYMDKHSPMVRFMGEFDFYFNEKRHFTPSEDIMHRFSEQAGVTENILTSIVEAGLEDGSIALPREPSVFVPTVTTVLWGTAQRVALRGSMIEEEFGVPGLEMVRCQIELYTDAIRRIPHTLP